MSDLHTAAPAHAPPRAPSPLGYILVGLLTLGLALMLAFRVTTDRAAVKATRADITTSYDRQIAAANLMLELTQAESAQRGYVITGDFAFLAPYAPARQELAATLARLAHLYPETDRQAARLKRFGGLATAKFAEMDETLRMVADGRSADAHARVADQQGRTLMETSEAVVQGFIVTDRATLDKSLGRVGQQRRSVDRWTIILLSALVVGLMIGLALAWRVRRVHYRLEHESWDALMRMRAIFDATSDAMLTLNLSGSIETVNAAATRMLGYAPGELERRDIATLVDLAPGTPQSDGESFERRVGLHDGVVASPFRTGRSALHRDGHRVPVDIALGAMRLADGDHLVVALRDISERYETERLKDEFVGTVSHELRTPLTSVIGALGLLRSGTAGALPPQAQRLADIAENNARRLIRLINDILDIDRIGSGRLTLDRATIDLDAIAARARDDAEGLSGQRGVRLVHVGAGEPLPVSGDGERLLQVIGNLLSNAIRFSPPGGTVRVTTARDGHQARLVVSDEGPGVPAEFRDRLFERFSQSAAGAAIPGGTGLGLAISREIVKAHDGTIWYESGDHVGARFCLALNLQATRPMQPPGDRHRVLVCEDDTDAAAVLADLIGASDIDVELCGTAREAQAQALTGRYDCVVLDLHLPDANGLVAVRALRAHEATRRLPLIVVAGRAAEEGGSPPAQALDVIDWIDKPVDRERLLAALTQALARAADGRPTLLHVDDDPDMLEVTAIGLADRGHMLQATSLAEARMILAHTTPDIVILDINLPDGSGFELMPALFAADGTAVPTIIYSASDVVPEVARPFEAALVKSRRSLETLSDTIRTVLAKGGEAA